uniref:Zinc-hook domain-containing protein n=1 Tax=Strigamia maritima TaxID=126957 RepID=T1JCH0_STRMM
MEHNLRDSRQIVLSMSSLQKMSIQGIRSFGPEDVDKQTLVLFTPLTLILGPNGTGKTTIIECLKYITTGDAPLNSGRGQSFIHDPKLANEMEVHGQVKLQFKDVNNQSVVVTRSVLLSQKHKRFEMKTLDGTITRVDKDGKKVSITSKCADLNKEMITCLGVSKPILNYVIFCHQEDSNWPLSEGKALKQKFDDIFAATRYIKALDNIKNILKDKKVDIKVYKEEIKYLRNNQIHADTVKAKLLESETDLTACVDSIKTTRDKLLPIDEKIQFIDRQESEIHRMNNKLVENQTKLKGLQKEQQDLRLLIKNFFNGTIDNLMQTINDSATNIKEKAILLNQYEDETEKKKRECDQLGADKSKLSVEIAKLETEEQLHNERINKRDNVVATLCRKFELETDIGRVGNLSDFDVKKVLKSMNDKLRDIQENGKKIKTESEENETRIQNEIDCLRDTKTKLMQSIKMKKDLMNKNQTEFSQFSAELAKISSSAMRLTQLEKELAKAESDLQKTEGTINIIAMRTEIDAHKKEFKDFEINLRKLDNELQKLNEQSALQTKIDILRKDKTTKSGLVRKIMSRHEETLTHLFQSIPTENIRHSVDNLKMKLNREIKEVNNKRQKLQIQLSQSESRRTMFKEQLKQKEEELRLHEEKIAQICGDQQFDLRLGSLEKSINEVSDEKGLLTGSRYVYQKFVEKLESRKPSCCPLCHREFEEDQDVVDLINDLNSKLNMIPSQVEKKEEIILSQKEHLTSMLELKPLKIQVENLTTRDIPQLKTNIKNLSDQIDQYKKDIPDLDDESEVKQTDEAMAISIHSDMVSLDQAQIDLKKMEKELLPLEAKLGSTDKNRTVKSVVEEKEALQKHSDEVKHNLEVLQEKLEKHTEQLQTQRDTVNRLKSDKLKITGQLQNQKNLEEKKVELLKSIEECKRAIEEANKQMQPLDGQRMGWQTEKDQVTMAKEEGMKQMHENMNVLSSNIRELEQNNKEIQQYIKEGKITKLQKYQQQLQETERKLTSTQQDRVKINQQIDQIVKDLSNMRKLHQEFEDNLKFQNRDKEVKEITKSIDELKETTGGFDSMSLIREKRKLEQERDKLKKERDQSAGRRHELESKTLALRRELGNDICKDADIKYRDKLINLKVFETISNDLQKYYRALDMAIMKHHSMKMNEINKIIRELWRNTYKGNDIDFIEIRSDDDDGSARVNLKKIYHYRVVMVKGDIILDMRGRCSAGQKVLASIVIRLALAETFGLNCGILALDEPTTNLDRENIDSLADALVDIVKARQKQRNFQLVIITHDEEFLERLGHSEFVDKYYRVGKDHRYLFP